jgi:hypothetical protein
MSLSSYHISFAIGCPRKILKKGFAASSASDATARKKNGKKWGQRDERMGQSLLSTLPSKFET